MNKVLSTEKEIESAIASSKWCLRHYQLLILCCVVNIIDGIDISIIFFSASSISAEFGISSSELATIFSISFFGMIFGSFFLPHLINFAGRRPFTIASVALISSSTLLIYFSISITQMIVLRFIFGIGVGAVFTVLSPTIAEYIPQKRRKLCINLINASLPLGSVIGGIFSIWFIAEYGWRYVFLFSGCIGFAALVGLLCIFPESINWLIRKGKENSITKINDILRKLHITNIKQLPTFTDCKKIATNRLFKNGAYKTTVPLYIAFFFSFSTLYFLKSWIPKFLQDAGMSLDGSITAGTILSLGGVAGIISLGILSSWFNVMRLIKVFMVFGALLMLTVANSSVHFALFNFSIFGIGFFVFGSFVSLYMLSMLVFSPEIRSVGLGHANALGRVGAILGFYVAGFNADNGISIGENISYFTLPLFISVASIWYLHHGRKNKELIR